MKRSVPASYRRSRAPGRASTTCARRAAHGLAGQRPGGGTALGAGPDLQPRRRAAREGQRRPGRQGVAGGSAEGRPCAGACAGPNGAGQPARRVATTGTQCWRHPACPRPSLPTICPRAASPSRCWLPTASPIRTREIVLGVMASMGTRTEQRARADAQGLHTFRGLATGSQQAYRVNVVYGGAKFSTTPFRLPEGNGYRARVPLKPDHTERSPVHPAGRPDRGGAARRSPAHHAAGAPGQRRQRRLRAAQGRARGAAARGLHRVPVARPDDRPAR